MPNQTPINFNFKDMDHVMRGQGYEKASSDPKGEKENAAATKKAARHQLEMKITSATNLKNVNSRGGGALKPYAVVWVETDSKYSTYTDDSGGDSHAWDQDLFIPFSTPIDESTLHVEFFHDKAPEDNATSLSAGSAKIELGPLSRQIGVGKAAAERAKRSYELTLDSTRLQGKFTIEIGIRKLGKRVVDDEGFLFPKEAMEYS